VRGLHYVRRLGYGTARAEGRNVCKRLHGDTCMLSANTSTANRIKATFLERLLQSIVRITFQRKEFGFINELCK
jgi:hypothetical protein